MKTIFSKRPCALLIGGLILGSPGFAGQSHAATARAEAVPSQFEGSAATWRDVRTGVRELDGIVAARKLAEVHEAAFNLRDSVRELRSGKVLSDGAQSKLQSLIKQVDALANDLDSSGDKNDLRGTVVNQRKMHVLLDQIAALYPMGALPKVGPIVSKTAVKDPVCRMTVDPATSSKVAYNGQTYYFCSKDETAVFAKNPAHYAKLYEELTYGKPRSYALSLGRPSQIVAGRNVPLTFAVRQAGSPAVVGEFQLIHEKLMHLIMVSDDLSWFAHEHPQLGRDGRFRLNWKFARPGRYLLFADFTPANGLNQILRSELSVSGAKAHNLPRLTPDTRLSKSVDGFDVAVKIAPQLQAGRASLLTYTITRNGKPVTDMQPYLGAMGHLMAIHQNGRDLVHTHVSGAGAGDDGLTITPEMATSKGPKFTYKLQLPTGGVYKIWAQFQRGGKILTVPFVFRVQGETMKNKMMTIAATAAAMGTMHAAPAKNAAKPASKASLKAAPQKIMVTLPGGYKTGAATVKAGKPVALTFYLKSDAGCGNIVAFPTAKWQKNLKVGEKATVTFTPKKSGTLAFACDMNMMKGSILVK